MKMIVYEPVGFFRITGEELERLCWDVLQVWPKHIVFTGKTFGAHEEYKCETFTSAYLAAGERLDATDFAQWSELAPIIFDFVSRAIKHSSFYLRQLDTSQIDVSPIVADLGAREDIAIQEA